MFLQQKRGAVRGRSGSRLARVLPFTGATHCTHKTRIPRRLSNRTDECNQGASSRALRIHLGYTHVAAPHPSRVSALASLGLCFSGLSLAPARPPFCLRVSNARSYACTFPTGPCSGFRSASPAFALGSPQRVVRSSSTPPTCPCPPFPSPSPPFTSLLARHTAAYFNGPKATLRYISTLVISGEKSIAPFLFPSSHPLFQAKLGRVQVHCSPRLSPTSAPTLHRRSRLPNSAIAISVDLVRPEQISQVPSPGT